MTGGECQGRTSAVPAEQGPKESWQRGASNSAGLLVRGAAAKAGQDGRHACRLRADHPDLLLAAGHCGQDTLVAAHSRSQLSPLVRQSASRQQAAGSPPTLAEARLMHRGQDGRGVQLAAVHKDTTAGSSVATEQPTHPRKTPSRAPWTGWLRRTAGRRAPGGRTPPPPPLSCCSTPGTPATRARSRELGSGISERHWRASRQCRVKREACPPRCAPR